MSERRSRRSAAGGWGLDTEKITSENPERRRDGWLELQQRLLAELPEEAGALRGYLLNLLAQETVPQVWRAGILALLACPPLLAGGPAPPPQIRAAGEEERPEKPMLLGNWTWRPMQQPSVVLALSAADHRRRDEHAVIYVARRLAYDGFPQTAFRQFCPDSFDLGALLVEDYQALCILGRLSIYGRETAARLAGEHMRFGFDDAPRPPGLAQGKLDPDGYHRIWEQGPDRLIYHSAKDFGEERIDYGLVQRYPVFLGMRHVVVINCAGASSLGTLAAAQWAAESLFRSDGALEHGPIETPPHTGPDSRMEALLEVRARLTETPWEQPDITLKKLYVDRCEWSSTAHQWRTKPPSVLSIERKHGRPERILFDHEPSPLTVGSQIFRLTVAIAELAQRNPDQRIEPKTLAGISDIWERPQPKIAYVRQQLRNLRARYLREALTVKGGVQLHAEVDEIEV